MAVSWIPKSAYTPETFQKKGRVTIMTKKKLFKMFTLALALVMLFSVTAFAGSVSWSENGVSCSGSISFSSATTTAGSPMYIEAIYTSTYQVPGGSLQHAWEQATNAGTNITAYADIPSNASIIERQGAHMAGSGSYHYSD